MSWNKVIPQYCGCCCCTPEPVIGIITTLLCFKGFWGNKFRVALRWWLIIKYITCSYSYLALPEGPSTVCPRGVPWKAVACSMSRQTSCPLPSTSSSSRSTTLLCCSISASFSEQLCTTSDSNSTAGKQRKHALLFSMSSSSEHKSLNLTRRTLKVKYYENSRIISLL